MGRSVFVVTSRVQWMHDDLAAGVEGNGLSGVRDLGVDLPRCEPEEVAGWWMPVDHAARVAATAGWALPLTSPGPLWLASLPGDMLGREVVCGTLGDAARWSCGGVLKLAEAKSHLLEASWFESVGVAAGAALEAGIPGGSFVQVADRWFDDVCCEHRHWLVEGGVVASDCYLHNGAPWNSDAFGPCDAHRAAAAELAAAAVAAVASPRSLVVDVAVRRNGQVFVLEANPSWSSGPYAADPAGVVAAVCAALDWDRVCPEWAWRPDPSIPLGVPLKAAPPLPVR